MAARRFSRLQKRLLAWLVTDAQRTRGMLEARGLLVIVRTHGGKAEALSLTAAGKTWAHQFAESCE
jgi:hypothetical protein